MKKQLLLFSALLCGLTAMQAQTTILEEDFETGEKASKASPLTRGEGWTTQNTYKGDDYQYNWYNYYRDPESTGGPTISGANCAACDGRGNDELYPGAAGPREEILLSPELNLNDTYELQFTWAVSPMNSQDRSRYDLQVRVVENNDLTSAETVFSIQDKNMLKESGVTEFPIGSWDRHISKVDLSDWKGKKVKLAFVYKMLTTDANIVWLDDITVKQFTPATGPVPALNMDRYNYGSLYIGEKVYSEIFTMTNVGKNGLKITGIDKPSCVDINIDTEKVNLDKNDQVRFQLSYTATMSSPAQADVTIHTTGGDVKIALSATKQFLPDGYTFEGFNQYFPPAGWKNNGWSWVETAIEGDHSAYCGGGYSKATLRSPRLDLTDGGKLTFTYYNQYDGETVPDNDITVELSADGGDNWTVVWTSEYDQEHLNARLTAEVELGAKGDDCYIRFVYPAAVTGDEEYPELSGFTLDRVLLPRLYGAAGVPTAAVYEAPANNAQEVYPKNIVLKWGPAQFAKGYKLYVGSNDEMNNLVDGGNMGDALTFTIAQADYATTYKWKVVPYNDKGDATSVSTWKFTTQPDASVMEFPYIENFDECENSVPTGWLSITDNEYENRRWSPNSSFAYSGTCLYTGWMSAGKSSSLTSPEFVLPAGGKGMTISFVWGDEHPRSLLKDLTGLLKKQNVPGGNGVSDVVFEIGCNGEWKQAAYLSENYNDDDDTKYWREENVDLTEYAGKRVQFRWTNHALSGRHNGASLDNIRIDGNVDDYAVFNQAGWDAGKINFGKACNSGDQFTMLNKGKKDLKVKSVTFGTNNFQSSIAAGTEIKVDEGITFNVQFNAGESASVVNDEMTVEFESGSKAIFPVKGEALAQDVIFYGFEMNPLDYNWKDDFTTMDVDKKNTHELGYYQTTIENDGARYAFTQAAHYNANLTAHTGIGTLAAAAPDNQTAADDWLITRPLKIAAGATFDFYARNLSTVNSVFVGDNDLHCVEVLVSETGNTKTSDFKTVMATKEMSYLSENQWHHFNVDLSAYAGKDIYVAVRHTTVSASFLAFFDDFTFNHVTLGSTPNAIDTVKGADSEVAVYTANGVLVAKGNAAQALQNLGKGMYVIKAANGKTVKTIRK